MSADTTTLLHALWSGATIVSIDVETCTADDGDHIVSVGAVKVHEDKTVGTFTSLVNPGGPVNNTWIHGITAADVAAAPDFAGIEPALTSFITPAPGERLILAAHNAGFDISRLRLEYERCGQELPNLPLLDTMRLAPLLGVTLRGPSLTLLLKTLNLVNANPHEALADATACSDALRRLLREAAKQGRSSLTDLLNDAGTRARKVTDVDAAPRVRTAERVGSRTHIPGEHLAGHAVTLPAKPLKKDVKGWVEHAAECVELLCPELHAKAQVAAVHAPGLLLHAERLLAAELGKQRVADGDRSRANTALLLTSVLVAACGTPADIVTAYDRVDAAVAGLAACSRAAVEVCPSCQDGEGCARDTWHHVVARAALQADEDDIVPKPERNKFSPPSGSRGRVLRWIRDGRLALAGHGLWLVAESWAAEGAVARRGDLAAHGWTWGLREPRLVVHHARRVKAHAGLDAAILVCEDALLHKTTAPGWLDVIAQRARLVAQAQAHPVRPRLPDDDVRLVRPIGREARIRFKPRS